MEDKLLKEFTDRVQEQVQKIGLELKDQLISHEDALAHFLVYTSLLYTGFGYRTNEFAAAFTAAIKDMAPNVGILRLDQPSGLPS